MHGSLEPFGRQEKVVVRDRPVKTSNLEAVYNTQAPSPTTAANPKPISICFASTSIAAFVGVAPPVAVAKKALAAEMAAVVGAGVADAEPNEPCVPEPSVIANIGE